MFAYVVLGLLFLWGVLMIAKPDLIWRMEHSGEISRKEPTEKFISAMRIGGLGVMMFPMQIFSDTGVKTHEKNPTEFSFVLGQANAAWYLIPSEAAFAYGGYDVDTSYFVKGAGEKIGRLLAEMVLMTTD